MKTKIFEAIPYRRDGGEKEITGPPEGAYIEEEGQIVAGFIGKELKEGWEKKLPRNKEGRQITKNMVYVVPQAYGYEWRLRYGYIKSQKTIDGFMEDELQWDEGGQPEEGRCDPRTKKEEQEEEKFPAAA